MQQPALHGLVNCSNKQYHGGPGISKSRLDAMAQGPRVYWNQYVNPNRVPREPTPTLTLGSACHSALLEPDVFPLEFQVLPELNLRKPADRELRDVLVQQWSEQGITALTQEQHDIAVTLRDVAHAHPEAGPLLRRMARAGSQAEQTYYATDPQTGLLVKCRFDLLATSIGEALDLKTTRGANEASFALSCIDYRYPVQQAWYEHVYTQATEGEAIADWVFLAIETEPPYQLGLYRLPRDVVLAARRQAMADLAAIQYHTELCYWPDPGYAGVVELQFSPWQRKKLGVEKPENDFPDIEE